MQAQTPRWLTAVTRSKCSIGSSAASEGGTWIASIVERHVEPAVLCDRAVDHRGNLRLIGDVAGDADCGVAIENDPLRLLRREIAVYVGQHDGGAALSEHPRRRQPHAFGGARDQGNLPIEIVDRVHLNLYFMLRSFRFALGKVSFGVLNADGDRTGPIENGDVIGYSTE